METMHASAVGFDGRAVLLTGASGSGKSTLALELMALGGVLVADDRIVVEPRTGGLWLEAPDRLNGKIEARGVGVLRTHAAPAYLSVVVDLDVTETERLPFARETVIMGVKIPLLHKVESPAFAAMLKVYLEGGVLA